MGDDWYLGQDNHYHTKQGFTGKNDIVKTDDKGTMVYDRNTHEYTFHPSGEKPLGWMDDSWHQDKNGYWFSDAPHVTGQPTELDNGDGTRMYYNAQAKCWYIIRPGEADPSNDNDYSHYL